MSNIGSSTRGGLQRLLRYAALVLVCFLTTTPLEAADTTVDVRSASLALNQDVYELDARLLIHLPEEARKAIDAGLTLKLEYQVELHRVRNYMPDAKVAELVQSYELTYHALSQRYLVRNLNTGEQQDFGSLSTALDRLSEVHGLPFVDAALVEPDRRYEAAVRGVVDLSTGPDALRWVLFWTDDWSASSEWYEWPLRH